MPPIGTGSPNSWHIVVDHKPGVAAGDHGSNACFVVEPGTDLVGTLSAALEFGDRDRQRPRPLTCRPDGV